MSNEGLKHTLRAAQKEIMMLRRRLEIAEAQVEVVSVFRHALAYSPPSQGYGEDVAWRLGKMIDEIDNPPAADAAEASA